MSVCTFIASDFPLTEFSPSREYPLEINIDNGTIYDGGADDNYFLFSFANVKDYTDKNYGVFLEWYYAYTKIGNRTYYLPEDVDSIVTKVEDRRKEAKWKGREI